MMHETDLPYLDAVRAIALFKDRKLSPVDLMTAIIARCEAVNPVLNAFTQTHYARAIDQARAAEAVYASRSADPRPLEGIPIAIKEFHAVGGEITSYGATLFQDNRTRDSAPTVERLLKAGAILHARTATPELAIGLITHSALHGVTRNPWNPEYSPCGSSGGAGAALAAGMTTLADGTDSGGSIRAPASACGIFGYLPPHGRNPSDADFAFEGLLRYGPMTRSVADAMLMQSVTAGPHPADPASFGHAPQQWELSGAPLNLRVGLSMDLGYFQIDPQVAASVRQGADVLRRLGCTVHDVDIPWTTATADAMNRYVEFLMYSAYGHLPPDAQAMLSDHIRHLIDEGRKVGADDLARFHAVRRTMYASIRRVFEDVDLLLCPTLSVPGVKADHHSMDSTFTVNGQPHGAYLEWGLTYPFNMLCYLPVACVPCGVADNNLPIGMQIVGKPFAESTAMRVAAAFERASPWAGRRPDL